MFNLLVPILNRSEQIVLRNLRLLIIFNTLNQFKKNVIEFFNFLIALT